MHWVPFWFLCIFFIIFARGYYSWRVVPAHKASYALRAKDEGNTDRRALGVASFSGDTTQMLRQEMEEKEAAQPRNSLHTTYKFGWCKPDAMQRAFLFRTANYSIVNKRKSDTQWIYVLDSENRRRFNLQCTVVKVYVRQQDALKRTRIPFHYCQGSVYYLMMNTVGRMMIHEFYFMARFDMPATFVFEYYHPSMV